MPAASTSTATPLSRGIGNTLRVPSDIVTGDFNQDGLTDIAVSFSYDDKVQWFAARGDGTFAPQQTRDVGAMSGPLNDLPRAMAVADFDRDGFPDIAVLCSGNPNSPYFSPPSLGILYGEPFGGFELNRSVSLAPTTASHAPQFSLSIIAADIDDDGQPDLIASHFGSGQISIIRHSLGREWLSPTLLTVDTSGSGPAEVKVADIDFDGHADLVITNRRDLQVWKGDGAGSFSGFHKFATSTNFTAIELGDFDLDGFWDVAALDGTTNKLRLFMDLTVAGTFSRQIEINLTGGTGPVNLIRYDANKDGIDDLALIYLTSGGGDVLLGTPTNALMPLTFARHFETSRSPRSLRAIDYDGDGYPDLATVNEGDEAVPQNEDVVFDHNPPLHSPAGDIYTAAEATTPGLQTPPYLDRPSGLGWDATRQGLWTLDRGERKLVLLSASGEVISSFPFSHFGISPTPDPTGEATVSPADPTDLAVDGEGTLWITDRLASRVIHVSGAGALLGGFTTYGQGLYHPAGIAYDPAGDRLIVSGERENVIVTFSRQGVRLRTYQSLPLRDLAWVSEASKLIGILEREPRVLVAFELNDTNNTTDPTGTFPLSGMADLLAGREARSIAYDPSTSRFWLLTASGALVQLANGLGDAQSIRELSLLRRIVAVAAEPGGTTLLGDSGLLATLVRLDATGHVTRTMPLNSLSESHPIEIAGLSRSANSIWVLDGARGDILRFSPDGTPQERIESSELEWRRLSGLHYDASNSSILLGSPGRLLQVSFSPTLNHDDFGVSAVEEFRIPATLTPSSISAGYDADEIGIFSKDRGELTLFGALPGTSGSMLYPRRTIAQQRLFPRKFAPAAAGPVGPALNRWQLVGSGGPTEITVNIVSPPNAADPSWRRYE